MGSHQKSGPMGTWEPMRTEMLSVPPLEPDSRVFNDATKPFMLFTFTEISDSLQVKSEEND